MTGPHRGQTAAVYGANAVNSAATLKCEGESLSK